MVKIKELTRDQIAVITSLHKAGVANKDIANTTGLSLRSVQRWTKKFRDAGGTDPPLQMKSTGRPRKTTQRAMQILKRQVDANPGITAPQIKKSNPVLLRGVSMRTVYRRLNDDLSSSHHNIHKKPGVTLEYRMDRNISFHRESIKSTKYLVSTCFWFIMRLTF